ncbi:MAG: DUF4293 domain-containing protein [Bacteroidales bacterium]|nr:DUF4293 domain-containing protein [Bacteroidales bacterium]MCM1148347.1 DUF4293 domain-containing protein [Bacteroidales bacterium]MCM1206960.1 DUF4293 domain-containing protein [Bacillota bacterium]MCM1511256.1 DUF4293 domain-containing protein [Clostridium sp.]
MIQRIQSVYLFLSIVAMVVCACLPIGTIAPIGMGAASEMYNLCTIDGNNGNMSFAVGGLFALLAAGVITSVINIFSFNNRKRQSRECLVTIMLLLLWIGLYAFEIYTFDADDCAFEIRFAACLPFAAIVLQWLARMAIKKDEKLIRSIDRIR